MTAGGHTVGLLELYVPSRSPQQHRNKNKRAFQNAVATALPGFLSQFGDVVIVVGDLNVVEPGHLQRLPVFGAWEYAFCRSFLVAGLTDAYRARYPEGLDHSRLGRSGAGYRIDHIFVIRQHMIQIRGCGYVQVPRRQGLIDHAAMTLTLAVALAATGTLR
ncbi:MAG TPA: hypothetical protein VH637_12290 [Streptosporangiaceae bacterium]